MVRNLALVVDAYNDLPLLEEADTELRLRPRGEAIETLLKIILKYGLSDSVGIRLLHKHNSLGIDELMAEDYLIDNVGFALVTSARVASEIDNEYVPNSWLLSDGEFVPMEFSKAQLVKRPTVNPSNNRDFFEELATNLKELKLSRVLGPSLLGSDFIEQNRPAGSTEMMEFTAQDERANVLRFVGPTSPILGTPIETHWCIDPRSTFDDPKRLVTMKCTKFCPYVQNPPVHQGTYIHQQS